jgi:hypothetical protein
MENRRASYRSGVVAFLVCNQLRGKHCDGWCTLWRPGWHVGLAGGGRHHEDRKKRKQARFVALRIMESGAVLRRLKQLGNRVLFPAMMVMAGCLAMTYLDCSLINSEAM